MPTCDKGQAIFLEKKVYLTFQKKKQVLENLVLELKRGGKVKDENHFPLVMFIVFHFTKFTKVANFCWKNTLYIENHVFPSFSQVFFY